MLRYTFLSKGESKIMKIIAYQRLGSDIHIPQKGKLKAYNLALGDTPNCRSLRASLL